MEDVVQTAEPEVVEQESWIQMDNGIRFHLWVIGLYPSSRQEANGDKNRPN